MTEGNSPGAAASAGTPGPEASPSQMTGAPAADSRDNSPTPSGHVLYTPTRPNLDRGPKASDIRPGAVAYTPTPNTLNRDGSRPSPAPPKAQAPIGAAQLRTRETPRTPSTGNTGRAIPQAWQRTPAQREAIQAKNDASRATLARREEGKQPEGYAVVEVLAPAANGSNALEKTKAIVKVEDKPQGTPAATNGHLSGGSANVADKGGVKIDTSRGDPRAPKDAAPKPASAKDRSTGKEKVPATPADRLNTLYEHIAAKGETRTTVDGTTATTVTITPRSINNPGTTIAVTAEAFGKTRQHITFQATSAEGEVFTYTLERHGDDVVVLYPIADARGNARVMQSRIPHEVADSLSVIERTFDEATAVAALSLGPSQVRELPTTKEEKSLDLTPLLASPSPRSRRRRPLVVEVGHHASPPDEDTRARGETQAPEKKRLIQVGNTGMTVIIDFLEKPPPPKKRKTFQPHARLLEGIQQEEIARKKHLQTAPPEEIAAVNAAVLAELSGSRNSHDKMAIYEHYLRVMPTERQDPAIVGLLSALEAELYQTRTMPQQTASTESAAAQSLPEDMQTQKAMPTTNEQKPPHTGLYFSFNPNLAAVLADVAEKVKAMCEEKPVEQPRRVEPNPLTQLRINQRRNNEAHRKRLEHASPEEIAGVNNYFLQEIGNTESLTEKVRLREHYLTIMPPEHQLAEIKHSRVGLLLELQKIRDKTRAMVEQNRRKEQGATEGQTAEQPLSEQKEQTEGTPKETERPEPARERERWKDYAATIAAIKARIQARIRMNVASKYDKEILAMLSDPRVRETTKQALSPEVWETLEAERQATKSKEQEEKGEEPLVFLGTPSPATQALEIQLEAMARDADQQRGVSQPGDARRARRAHKRAKHIAKGIRNHHPNQFQSQWEQRRDEYLRINGGGGDPPKEPPNRGPQGGTGRIPPRRRKGGRQIYTHTPKSMEGGLNAGKLVRRTDGAAGFFRNRYEMRRAQKTEKLIVNRLKQLQRAHPWQDLLGLNPEIEALKAQLWLVRDNIHQLSIPRSMMRAAWRALS